MRTSFPSWLLPIGGFFAVLIIPIGFAQLLFNFNTAPLWNFAFRDWRVTAAVLFPLFCAWLAVLKRFEAPSPLAPARYGFPRKEVDLWKQVDLARRKPDRIFVGMTPRKRRTLFGRKWEPLYLSDKTREAHRHVLGKTGSGKTTSILWCQVLQDTRAGKGTVIIDAKGSDESLLTLKAIAHAAGRAKELKVFSLPAWNDPGIFSHAYNLVYVKPRTAGSRGGDPVPMAERVLSVLPLGTDIYFKTQAEGMFTNLCRLLHGIVDKQGNGEPFNLEDLAVCLRGLSTVGVKSRDPNGRALAWCLEQSSDAEAVAAVRSQLLRLGSKADEVLSGLSGAVDRFQSPLVNAYAPDIVPEDVLETNGLLYVQAPTNLFKLQAPAIGKAMLMDIQQAGSLRQVYRRQRNQRPFSVVVDEFASFADRSIIDSLNKLRDAHLMYTLSHQSLADLELVSKEFASAVFDNCLVRDLLSQDNPELCDRIAKSLGTYQRTEKTVKMQAGMFGNELTGDMSARLVDAYRLHPNALKALPACGQGYLLGHAHRGNGRRGYGDGPWPVSYPRLPEELEEGMDYPLQRNDQSKAKGLRLKERFAATAGAEPGGTRRSERSAPQRALRVVDTRSIERDVSTDPPSK